MNKSINFLRTIILLLFSICFAAQTASAQCDKKDSECWLEEGIYQIEKGDFGQAKIALRRTYRGVLNSAPKEIKEEVNEIIENKLPNYYEPIFEHFQLAEQNRAEGQFVNAIEQYKAAEKLAERNLRFVQAHTEELDQQLLDKITDVLPTLETERKQAFETAIAIADEELSKENYPRALSNYLIALREGTVAQIASNQIQQKADKCNFHVHLNKAKDFLAAQSCATAFEHITKAVSYNSSPEARRVLGEATECAHDNEIIAGNGQLETHQYEAAMAHFEKAKVYKSNSLEATNGLIEAKNQAAKSYVDQAAAHFDAQNHAAAAEDFEKAMSYNPNVVNTEGESISSLIEKHFNALNGSGESFYAQKDYLGAAADFKAASYYKNKELMEKREAFVLAVHKAYELEQTPKQLATIQDLQQLKSDWNQAKQLMNEANLSGGINVENKIKDLGSDISIAVVVEGLLPNLATATLEQKNAARNDLNKIKLDCKYKTDALAKLGSGLPTLTATMTSFLKTVYDFNSKAPYAQWKAGKHGSSTIHRLSFGVDSKNKGSARMIRQALENGQTKSVLHTHPTWTSNGVIRGYFPEISRLPANAKLTGSYGFLKISGSPKTDGAKFLIYIHYYVGQVKKSEQIFNSTKAYDGKTRTINLDLSKFAGKRVSFELRVDTGKTPTQDWAMWDGLIVQAK